jgi:hypothetical protein
MHILSYKINLRNLNLSEGSHADTADCLRIKTDFLSALILFFRANQRAIQKSKIITQTESSEDKKRAKKISPPFKKPLFQLTVPPGIVVV